MKTFKQLEKELLAAHRAKTEAQVAMNNAKTPEEWKRAELAYRIAVRDILELEIESEMYQSHKGR